jgi:DNA primase
VLLLFQNDSLSTVILTPKDQMENQVEEVKQKTDIVAIIGERVSLKKAGSNFRGLCPFHNEKSPSFMVSPELQIYKCFGCQAAGDVLTFLEEYEGMEFYEALKLLAEKAGVKLKSFGGNQKGYKDRLFEVNGILSNFYHYVLLKHPAGEHALEYMTKNRKLDHATIEKFNIGFSPDIPLALKNYVIDRKKVSLKELSDVGVIYTSGPRNFDRFRGRIIFPLLDHRGNIVGFAGRILPDNPNTELAKYINTPETSIYKKSNILFGLNEARADIKKKSVAIVVEGELDMISSFQAGINNVVAIKGSALTEEQAILLSRFAKTIILALDSDFAGNEAAKRGIFIAEKAGLEVKVAEIKGFKDPDEAAHKDPDKLKKFIENAVGIWDFIIDFTFSKYEDLDGVQKTKIGKELIPLLSNIDNKITQSHYISLLSARLGIPMEAVLEEMKKNKKGTNDRTIPSLIGSKSVILDKTRREMLEDRFLSLVFKADPFVLKTKKYSGILKTLFAMRICEELEKFKTNVKISEFAKVISPELKDKFSDLILKDVEGFGEITEEDILKEIETVAREIKILDTKERLEEIGQKIRKYESLEDKRKLKIYEKKFSLLTKKLSHLKVGTLRV